MKKGRVKGGAIIPATIDTGRRKRSSMAQPIRNMAGSPRGTIGGAAQNIIEITSDDLVQNGGQYKLMGGTPLPMKIVTGRRSKQGAAQVVYPVDALGNYDPTFAGYIYKVLTADPASGYDPSSLISFWTQNELTGAVSIDYSGFGHNGVYTAVTLGQAGVPGFGMSAASYDGAASFNNIHSASLNAEFDGAEGTLLAWQKVSGVGVWTDGVDRYSANFRVDAANQLFIRKHANNNRLDLTYVAGGTSENVSIVAHAPITYQCYAMTWNKAANQMIAYLNGSQTGAIQAIAGIWAGNLSATRTVIGSVITTPANVYDGTIGPVLLYNTAKTPTEIAYLSTR